MFLIGLTGGISSGKSTVSSYLKDLGILVIDADELSRIGDFVSLLFNMKTITTDKVNLQQWNQDDMLINKFEKCSVRKYFTQMAAVWIAKSWDQLYLLMTRNEEC